MRPLALTHALAEGTALDELLVARLPTVDALLAAVRDEERQE